jgi:hypothetical protein
MTVNTTAACGAVAIRCADCGRHAGVLAHGWHAYFVPENDLSKAPALAGYCPACMKAFNDAVEAIHARARATVDARALAVAA